MYNVNSGIYYTGVQSISPAGIVNASNGLSFDGDYVLGQTVSEPGSPAALLNNREIPLDGNTIEFTDDTQTSIVKIGRALLELDSDNGVLGQPAAMFRFNETGTGLSPVLFELSTSPLTPGGAMLFNMGGFGGILLFTSGHIKFTNDTSDTDSGQQVQIHGSTGVRGRTANLNFPNTNAQTSSDLTISLTTAVVGDMVWLGVPTAAILPNSSYSAWVSAPGVVTVRFNNYSAAAQNPASGLFAVYTVTPI